MRSVVRVLFLILSVWVSIGIGGSGSVAAQETPKPRAGRLGGSVEQFEKIHGEADKRTEKLLDYESIDAVGTDVTAHLFKEKVYRIVVDWPEDDIAAEEIDKAVDVLAPSDGTCEEKSVRNDLGKDVFQCHSVDLERGFTVETMNSLGTDGERGDYYYSVETSKRDGTTVILGLGHDKYTAPPPTPVPTPTWEEKLAAYAPLADVRELAIRPGGLMGQKIFFYGTILTIQVAGPGMVAVLGDDESIGVEAAIQVTVAAPDGSTEVVFVGTDSDTAGMFEGSYIVVYGEVVGTQTFTNAFGGSISQPLVEGFHVALA